MTHIAKVEAIPIRLQRDSSPAPADQLPGSNFYRTPHRGLIYAPHSDRVYVKITTDEGHVGWGECGVMGATITAEIVRTFLASQVVGQDPIRVEFLWWQMRRSMWDRGSVGGFLSGGCIAAGYQLCWLYANASDSVAHIFGAGRGVAASDSHLGHLFS